MIDTNQKAMYECIVCSEIRQYGCVAPVAADSNYLPLIYCEKCDKLQRHQFAETTHKINPFIERAMRWQI